MPANDIWRKVVERSWADGQYRQDLLDNPNKVLAEAGIKVPTGVNFVVVENEPDRLHLVLPQRPGDAAAADGEDSALTQYNAAVVF
ncbi:MAG: NHLP leader peptide family natural product precursor [Armatimonadetes bacterium]|nr:NHLP leader peptide family natural product precursor [Armatimonadota bacterium]